MFAQHRLDHLEVAEIAGGGVVAGEIDVEAEQFGNRLPEVYTTLVSPSTYPSVSDIERRRIVAV